MFQFPGLAREFRDQCLFDSFPGLIAAFHALHRLLVPRHPPHALRSLTTKIHASPTHRLSPANRSDRILPIALYFDRLRSKFAELRMKLLKSAETDMLQQILKAIQNKI